MKWISIKDRLPSNGEDSCEHDAVLVYSDQGGISLIGIACYNKDPACDNKYKWYILDDAGAVSCEGFASLESDDVTHWMPLPLAPGWE